MRRSCEDLEAARGLRQDGQALSQRDVDEQAAERVPAGTPPRDAAPSQVAPASASSLADDGPHRGGIYWVDVDAPDGVAPNYRHPHVVIQEDVLNCSRIHTVVVCAISSNPRRATEPGNVRLDEGEGNLPKPSVVIVSQVSSIPKGQLGAWLGTLSEQRVQQILDGLRFQQHAHFRGR